MIQQTGVHQIVGSKFQPRVVVQKEGLIAVFHQLVKAQHCIVPEYTRQTYTTATSTQTDYDYAKEIHTASCARELVLT